MKTEQNTPGGLTSRRISYLVNAFQQDSISEKELVELNAWLETDVKNCYLFNEITLSKKMNPGLLVYGY